METKKILVWIAGGIALFVVILVLIKTIAKNLKKDITASIVVVEGNLHYPFSQYKMWADQLFRAMNGSGTDERTVESIILQLKNIDDWNQVVKDFGTRATTSWISSFSGTLHSWLQNELTSREIRRLNDHLSKLGITL